MLQVPHFIVDVLRNLRLLRVFVRLKSTTNVNFTTVYRNYGHQCCASAELNNRINMLAAVWKLTFRCDAVEVKAMDKAVFPKKSDA